MTERIKLLIVDDELKFLDSISKRLELRDFAVTKASSGAAAVPPSAPSMDDIRTDSGLLSGHAARTISTISSGKRMRPLRSPPYSSVRTFDIGDRNE